MKIYQSILKVAVFGVFAGMLSTTVACEYTKLVPATADTSAQDKKIDDLMKQIQDLKDSQGATPAVEAKLPQGAACPKGDECDTGLVCDAGICVDPSEAIPPPQNDPELNTPILTPHLPVQKSPDLNLTIVPPALVQASAPTITLHVPDPNMENVSVDSVIVVTFDQPMDVESVKAHFTVYDKTIVFVPGAVTTEDSKTFVFHQASSLKKGTLYTASLAGSKSPSGLSVAAGPDVWSFQTEQDSTPHVVSAWYDVSEKKFHVQFDQPMDVSSVVSNFDVSRYDGGVGPSLQPDSRIIVPTDNTNKEFTYYPEKQAKSDFPNGSYNVFISANVLSANKVKLGNTYLNLVTVDNGNY